MNDYYVTWAEKKYGSYFNYIRVIPGSSVKEIKELMQKEQDQRRLMSKPHMFTIKVTRSRPDERILEKYHYEKGHLYY